LNKNQQKKEIYRRKAAQKNHLFLAAGTTTEAEFKSIMTANQKKREKHINR